MKVKVVRSHHDKEEWAVEVSEGVQHFRLDYSSTKADCKWMAKMFMNALAKHDEQKRIGM
jgi:hypothetical protein